MPAILAIADESLILPLTPSSYGAPAMSENDLIDQQMLFEVVENQLADQYPKIVSETLMRLRMTGNSQQEAIELIACALGPEMIDVIEHKQPFNMERYSQHLALLPATPWLEEE